MKLKDATPPVEYSGEETYRYDTIPDRDYHRVTANCWGFAATGEGSNAASAKADATKKLMGKIEPTKPSCIPMRELMEIVSPGFFQLPESKQDEIYSRKSWRLKDIAEAMYVAAQAQRDVSFARQYT